MSPQLYMKIVSGGGPVPKDGGSSLRVFLKRGVLPMGSPVARDATAVSIPSVTPMERAAADYYNPPVEDVSSGSGVLDFAYRNPWINRVPLVGRAVRGMAMNAASNSGGKPVVDMHRAGYMVRGGYKGDSYKGDSPSVGRGTDMLGVYFGRSKLPPSVYRPTSDYLEFLPSYSIKGDFDESFSDSFPDILKGLVSEAVRSNNYGSGHTDRSDSRIDEDRVMDGFLKDRKPVYFSMDENTELLEELGVDLGGHKMGLAWDDEADLPYMSISDAWDFEPRHYAKKWGDEGDDREDRDRAYVQASLMHRAGKPFKVYDRFYFDPVTRRYIPDSEVAKRKK